MVEKRSGDNINLLDSSIRSVSGTVVSTTLYVTSGIIYAFVAGASVTGTYLFLAIFVGLIMRPVRGVSQALHKIGSESGESTSSYLMITLSFSLLYFLVFTVILYGLSDIISSYTIYQSELYPYVLLISLGIITPTIAQSLLSASGYPGYVTWLNGFVDFLRLSTLVILATAVTSVQDMILILSGVKILVTVPFIIYISDVPSVPTKDEIKRVWSYSRWSIPDQLVDKFSYNMPVYILGVVSTPAAVGVYEAADRFADFGATICWNLSSPLLSKVSGEWSVNKESAHEYLDSAVTGGTGFTFIVFGYVLTATDLLAEIAFPQQQRVFAITIVIVGGVNLLRGIWTLLSHALEGINKPAVSFATKVYGLIISVPITVLLGMEIGAIGGAFGYGVMNLIIFSYVVLYSKRHFGRIVYDWNLTVKFVIGTIISSVGTYLLIAGLQSISVPQIYVAILSAFFCIITYGISLYVLSEETRRVFARFREIGLT